MRSTSVELRARAIKFETHSLSETKGRKLRSLEASNVPSFNFRRRLELNLKNFLIEATKNSCNFKC